MQNPLLSNAMYLWSALWLFWLISAIKTKRTTKRQSLASRIGQALPVMAAFVLLSANLRWTWWFSRRFLPASPVVGWAGLALTAAGIAFAVWARLWIGRNWSGTVTIKEEHELIQSGPYALVRHPIYSGFLLAFLGTAIIEGQVHALLGFVCVLVGWWLKLRTEETFMLQQFGNAYAEYMQRVKALVPFVV